MRTKIQWVFTVRTNLLNSLVVVTLREIKDGRRFTFDVECHNEDGVKIGDGTHWRSLINIAQFASRG